VLRIAVCLQRMVCVAEQRQLQRVAVGSDGQLQELIDVE
jgi:hypothetical protein